jgi:hypothetical protein
MVLCPTGHVKQNKCDIFTAITIKRYSKARAVRLNVIKRSGNLEGNTWFSGLVAISTLTELS